MAAEICAQHVADEQRIAVEAIRRKRAEFVLPLADDSARPHFESDERREA